MNTIEEQVVTWLKDFQPNSSPSAKEIKSPNYSIYALAPHWLPHQAICFLCEIASIDIDSFHTMLSLTPPQWKMKQFLPVVRKLPINSEKVQLLKNTKEKMHQAIQKGSLETTEKIFNDRKQVLLQPRQVIEWAIKEKLLIPNNLIQEMEKRSSVNFIYFDLCFPDEINVYVDYLKSLVKINLNKPGLLASVCSGTPMTAEAQRVLWTFKPWKDNQNEKEDSPDATSPVENLEGFKHRVTETSMTRYTESEKSHSDFSRDRRISGKFDKEGPISLDQSVCMPTPLSEETSSCQRSEMPIDPKTSHPPDDGHSYIEKNPERIAEKEVPSIIFERTNITASESQFITESGKTIRQRIINCRIAILELSLEEKFESLIKKKEHSYLITDLCNVPEELFKKYKTKRLPPKLEMKHRFLARARFLRVFDPQISITSILEDPFLKQYVWKQKNSPTKKTILSWLREERIPASPSKARQKIVSS